jgi:hypothetical protein
VLQCSRGRRGEIKSSKAYEGSLTLIKHLSFFFNVKKGDEKTGLEKERRKRCKLLQRTQMLTFVKEAKFKVCAIFPRDMPA